MASTCSRILDACLRGEPWDPADLRAAIASESLELFSVLAEGLSDRFEPRLVDAYGAIFSEVIAAAAPEFDAAALRERYARARRQRRFTGDPAAIREVAVLSRVTLGADIAVTSVVLDGARRAFPNARIRLAGGRKSYDLFAADPRIEWLPVTYGRRESLRGRLAAGLALRQELESGGVLVIDPDSRITQLGLLPVAPEEDYYYFDSRAFAAESDDSLACLASRWMEDTFGVAGARPYLALEETAAEAPDVAVSLGVGENLDKRVPDPFEPALLAALAERFESVVVDTGPGGEEAARARRAVAASPRLRTLEGSFHSFAALIARSRLYVGYDSSGQHAAAALGIPLVTVFAGFPSDRFAARWRPCGRTPSEVVLARDRDPERVLAQVLSAIDRLVS